VSEQAFPAGRVRDGPSALPRRALPYALAATALTATAGAVLITATSRHAPHPVTHAALTVVVCFTYVGAGLVALRLRPYARFGVLLCAVGFSVLLGSLHDANSAVPYTIGVLTANLVFAVLVHAVLAFPTGRLRSRTNRILALTAYVAVLGVQTVAVLFDPLTRWHSDHPRNAALIDAQASLSTGLEEFEAAIALAVALAVTVVLFRRMRAETETARRQLVPVLAGGSIALLVLAVGLALAPLSSGAAVIGIGLGLLVSCVLPVAFLGVAVQGKLSRAAVGALLVELREGTKPEDLQDALRRALGDPSLELAYRRPDGEWVDRSGRPIAVPTAGDRRTATPIRHQGARVGALIHDRSLRLRPELLEAVSAATGFALANEAALETIGRVEHRNRALLDALPDPMIRVSRDGTYLDVRAEDHSQLLFPPEELIGRNIRDVLPPELADDLLACVADALDTGRVSSLEYEIEIGGERRWKETRMTPSGGGEVLTIVRDFTDERHSQAQLQRLAEEQAALRRVATLVAGEAPPDRVFQVVTEEVAKLLGLRSALLLRYEDVTSGTVVGRFGPPPGDFELGTTLRLEEGASITVLRTGAPARVDYGDLRGTLAARMRAHGFSASVGVPIFVAGSIWGAIIAAIRVDETLQDETEKRLGHFAELVALAVASAQARDELTASRLRIIEASDAERRRIERNLHDGAQQRLVALAVGLRLVQSRIGSDPAEAERLIGIASEELGEALTELRELAQGIHPAVLTERGLTEALAVLAARTPLPVDLEVRLPERLPPSVEATAYYVVSEALANVVKHAGASTAQVRVWRMDGLALVEVADDGAGQVDPERGSGLRGLRDRVETLNGRLDIDSADGTGTRIRARLPAA
jgi:PAS domain S-box-containing protein